MSVTGASKKILYDVPVLEYQKCTEGNGPNPAELLCLFEQIITDIRQRLDRLLIQAAKAGNQYMINHVKQQLDIVNNTQKNHKSKMCSEDAIQTPGNVLKLFYEAIGELEILGFLQEKPLDDSKPDLDETIFKNIGPQNATVVRHVKDSDDPDKNVKDCDKNEKVLIKQLNGIRGDSISPNVIKCNVKKIQKIAAQGRCIRSINVLEKSLAAIKSIENIADQNRKQSQQFSCCQKKKSPTSVKDFKPETVPKCCLPKRSAPISHPKTTQNRRKSIIEKGSVEMFLKTISRKYSKPYSKSGLSLQRNKRPQPLRRPSRACQSVRSARAEQQHSQRLAARGQFYPPMQNRPPPVRKFVEMSPMEQQKVKDRQFEVQRVIQERASAGQMKREMAETARRSRRDPFFDVKKMRTRSDLISKPTSAIMPACCRNNLDAPTTNRSRSQAPASNNNVRIRPTFTESRGKDDENCCCRLKAGATQQISQNYNGKDEIPPAECSIKPKVKNFIVSVKKQQPRSGQHNKTEEDKAHLLNMWDQAIDTVQTWNAEMLINASMHADMIECENRVMAFEWIVTKYDFSIRENIDSDCEYIESFQTVLKAIEDITQPKYICDEIVDN